MADPAIQLHPEPLAQAHGTLELGATIQARGAPDRRIWYRLPLQWQSSVTDQADPFVIAASFLAMRSGLDMHVHGRVSPTLLRHLEEVQLAWHRWRPDRYRAVEITADIEAEADPPAADQAVMAFSGGVDSCFTAWRHTLGGCGRLRRNIRVAVMVHGFDIPLHEVEIFEQAADRSGRILKSTDVKLATVACNFRELGDDWEDAHGAAIASCLHLFAGGFRTGLIASSHVYEALRFPWGSTPLLDPMLSSAAFSIVYDGAGYSRWEKTAQIAQWPEAMSGLRVCWEGKQKDRNCGTCIRCISTALCFAAEQVAPPAVLHVDTPERAVRRLGRLRIKPVARMRLEEIKARAQANGITEPWVRALAGVLRSKRRREWAERMARHVPMAERVARKIYRFRAGV